MSAAARWSEAWRRVPCAGGDVRLLQDFLASEAADLALERVLGEVVFRQEQVVVCGRASPMPRLTAWQGDEGAVYRYSGVTHLPAPWTAAVRELKERVEQAVQPMTFNSVLLNLYRDERDSLAWHADDEPELGTDPIIASLTLGAVRPFQMRRRTAGGFERFELALRHGSLLLMAGRTQSLWQHRVPKRTTPVGLRLNLTFRRILGEGVRPWG